MKTIGLIGGMTPEATKDYYSILIDLGRTKLDGKHNNPVMIIYSINLSEFIGFIRKKDEASAQAMLVDAFNNLKNAGAEIGALTANTPHVFFDEISSKSQIPLISIVEATFDAAKSSGCKKCLLLGTTITMRSDMFPNRFNSGGIDIIIPDESDQEFIMTSIFRELGLGIFKPETKAKYIEICKKHIENDSVDAVILGCTEIPLIMHDGDLEIPLLNTTKIHAERIFEEAQKN
jgi:aspartate racemase